MKKQYLEMAKITKPVGLKGELRAQLFCDEPELLTEFELFLGKEHTPCEVVSVRTLKNDMVAIKLKGCDSLEKAQLFANKLIYLNRDDAELPEDTFFIADIIGCSVFDADSGRLYGKVDEVLQNGATDVYSIKTETGKQLLFPAIPEVLLEIDINAEKILIRPLKNLFELEGEDENAD